MGQLGVTILGGVVGSFFGMPQLGLMVGGLVGGALFAPTIEGPRLDDLKITTSTYGNEIPRIYGAARVAGNVIWSNGIEEVKETKRAGKGGPKQTTYKYFASFAVAFCAGPITDITRVWGDSKLMGELPRPSPDNSAWIAAAFSLLLTKGGGKQRGFAVYRGDEDQLPDPFIESIMGKGNVPAYRGLCYIVFKRLPLDDYGNRIPSISAEIINFNADHTQGWRSLNFDVLNGSLGDVRGIGFDWRSQKVIAFGTGGLAVFDASTGLETRRFTPRAGLWAGGAQRGNYAVTQHAVTNARPIRVYSTTSGALVSEFGRESSNTNYSPIGDNKGIPTDAFGFIAPLNQPQDMRPSFPPISSYWMFPMTTTGGTTQVIAFRGGVGDTRHCGFYSVSGACLGWTLISDDMTFADMILGRENRGQLVTHAWNNKGTGFRIYNFTIGAVADGFTASVTDGPQVYRPPAGSGCNVIDMTPAKLPTEFAGYTNIACRTMVYCASDDTLVAFGTVSNGVTTQNVVFKINPWTAEFEFVRAPASLRLPPFGSSMQSECASQNYGYLVSHPDGTARLQIVNIATGALESETITPFINASVNNVSWDALSQSGIKQGGEAFIRFGRAIDKPGISLAEVVEDICSRTGLLSTFDLDTTALEDEIVNGFVVSRGTAKASIDLLSTAYFFDGVETDYKIKFKKRGGGPVAALTQSKLMWLDDNGELVKETRTQETELPARVVINYAEPERDYQTGSQSAKRLTAPVEAAYSRTEEAVQLPLSLTATEAKQIAEKLLKMVWRGRTSIEGSASWESVLLDPCDVITVTLDDGTQYLARLTKVQFGADMTIRFSAALENNTSYISNAEADPSNFPPRIIKSSAPINLEVINTPLLRDKDDTQGISSLIYLAAWQDTEAAFSTGYIFESSNDEDYSGVNKLETGILYGECLSALPATNGWGALDETSELTVLLLNAGDRTLENCTFDDLLAGANMAIVGQEVVQFMTAEMIGDDMWKLSDFVRAARGTNFAVNNHKVGERFMLLEEGNMVGDTRPPADFISTQFYKIVPPNYPDSAVFGIPYDLQPNDLKPYTPELVKLVEDDGTSVKIAWTRRSRITAPLTDYTGQIHYKEGQVALGTYSFRFWKDATLADAPWDIINATPAVTGSMPVYDVTEGLYEPDTTQPLTSLMSGTEGSFVFEVWENGIAEGFHKFVQFERLSTGEWNLTELY